MQVGLGFSSQNGFGLGAQSSAGQVKVRVSGAPGHVGGGGEHGFLGGWQHLGAAAGWNQSKLFRMTILPEVS